MSKKTSKERVPSPGRITLSPFPGSVKTYAAGSRPDLKVPARQIALTATGANGGQAPGVTVYDTSGPYTDPASNVDIHAGLPPVRQTWIVERGDTEEVSFSASPYTTIRSSDKRLDEIRFPVPKRGRRAKPGLNVSQMHYARKGIVTPEMEFVAIRENQ
ncbi:MAG: phosphomethylpyrimidine synthase ThiC, partial [Acidobacteria bacterium]